MITRVLLTGSREWTNRPAIVNALADTLAKFPEHQPSVLIHGGAKGADAIAHAVWEMWVAVWPERHHPAEVYPANWRAHPKAAGPVRNSHMVKLGADVCIAFPIGLSRGTRDCMAKAAKAGIKVINFGDEEPS